MGRQAAFLDILHRHGSDVLPAAFPGPSGHATPLYRLSRGFAYWNYISSWGAFLSFASFVFFIGIVFYTLLAGKRVSEKNYWNEYADTLEWTLPTPPPEHTFEILAKQEEWDRIHNH